MSIIHSEVTTATLEQFWKAVSIWNKNPHVVNRRLCGAVCLFTGKILNSESKLDTLLSQIKAAHLKITNSITGDEILQALQSIHIEVEEISEFSDLGIYIFIKKLLPRNSNKFQECLELVILDKFKNEALFMGLQESNEHTLTPDFPYSFCYIEKEIILKSYKEDDGENTSLVWIKQHLFPKIMTWAETATTDNKDSCLVKSSLNLVDIVKYSQLYQQLKKKYGPEMVKIWPENTDPLKFVYEDVAIATYLLLLWEQERQEKGTPDVYQTFVDLGCGNGLLVHILNSEGYQGIGIDVRKRKIWDLYPSTTKLEIRPIVPSSENLFPDADWLIGNHSDELTPWIPVISARSSYSCRFFLLPCCCYEFSGRKYQRSDASRSQYEDYLEYIFNLSKTCGFVTKPDRLKIPSTRRICFIGASRNYPEEDTKKIDFEIKRLIGVSEIGTNYSGEDLSQAKDSGKWSQEFTPRENVEKVRNCTQLEKSLIQELVSLVAKQLLLTKHQVVIKTEKGEKTWNKGGSISIGDLASILPSEPLKRLKNEFGGLKTLLKNNGHIFLVQGAQVQLKVPSTQVEAPPRKKSRPNSKPRPYSMNIKASKKQKPCWFHTNHPDGCPLQEEDCLYKH